ncbi:thioesterase family protein [Actinoplanes oblitus]|uniref:Thioesterase family protein n=1 Tax=Actinoplanes oblitus TaxID=3040509 RepID=A0ABY8WM12_9ACTN|nr:thioesterase family protein [Actinoplanes oblitus]WIM98678.1 thioesterase family protein [Actinoplanes oblitus]
MTVGAFYLPVGEHEFESTPATASPWDFSLQHGGPPAALLARAMQRCGADRATPLARVTVDFLGGIPQGRLRTEARVLRPGRRVELLEAEMWADGKLAVQASAWRIRQRDGATAGVATPAVLPPPVPPPSAGWSFGGISPDWGYGNAIEWRFVAGGFADPGPASVWTRVRIPLVAGEQTTPEQRAMIVADSANGLSGELPMADWLFIPPTLTVTFQRVPASEWMFLDAASTIGPNGTGIAQGTISDERGLVCRISQPLLVAPR